MIAAATREVIGLSGCPLAAAPLLELRHLIVTGSDGHPSQANGVHNVARQLAREQIAAGHQARIIFLSSLPPLGQVSSTVPTDVLPAAGVTLGGRVVRLQRKILRTLMAEVGPRTLFHIHGGREPLLIDIASGLRRSGIPYAITAHGRYSHVYDTDGRCRRPVTAFYLATMERSLLANAHFVQALSHHEWRVLRQIAPRARIEIVGNGVYSSHFESMPLPPPGRMRSPSFPHFVYCGRYAVWHKGLDLLLEGFAGYKRNGGEGRLTMIGSGDPEPLLRLATSLEISNSLEVRGALFGVDRDTVLRDCDFFVMPSRFEGMPLAGLEAALLGLPLLVTPGTGLGEAVAAACAGIPIADATPFAVCNAMREAARFSPREWSQRSAAVYQLAVSDGDWTVIAARLLELYWG